MKTENLKKLAEIIVSEAAEAKYDTTPSIGNYYKVLDYEDAKQLDKFFDELDDNLWNDEWYISPSAEYIDIWAGKFADVVEEHKPVEFHYENGKQIVDKYEEDCWTPFIDEHKKDIEDIVSYYAWNSEKFGNNLLEIFKDYIDMKRVTEEVYQTVGPDMEEEELLEQFNNGEALN